MIKLKNEKIKTRSRIAYKRCF